MRAARRAPNGRVSPAAEPTSTSPQGYVENLDDTLFPLLRRFKPAISGYGSLRQVQTLVRRCPNSSSTPLDVTWPRGRRRTRQQEREKRKTFAPYTLCLTQGTTFLNAGHEGECGVAEHRSPQCTRTLFRSHYLRNQGRRPRPPNGRG